MRVIICNAFSLSMLDRDAQRVSPKDPLFRVRCPYPVDDARAFLEAWNPYAEIISAVDHAADAAVFSGILGYPVEVNRVSVKVDSKTILLVGQYIGPSLPEGATTLPEWAVMEWWAV